MSTSYKNKVSHSRTLLNPTPVVPPMRARPRDNAQQASPPAEFTIGPFKVRVSNKQHYRLYTICTPSGDVIGKQASYPSIYDCLEKLDTAAGKGHISYALQAQLHGGRETQRALKERSAA